MTIHMNGFVTIDELEKLKCIVEENPISQEKVLAEVESLIRRYSTSESSRKYDTTYKLETAVVKSPLELLFDEADDEPLTISPTGDIVSGEKLEQVHRIMGNPCEGYKFWENFKKDVHEHFGE